MLFRLLCIAEKRRKCFVLQRNVRNYANPSRNRIRFKLFLPIVTPWPQERLLVGRFRFAAKIACAMNSWASITKLLRRTSWANKRIVRPAKRWDDRMESFAQEIFYSSWCQTASYETWSSHDNFFCTMVLGTWTFGF